MITIGIMGIATVLLAIQFKTIRPEYGIMISVAGCILIFINGISKIGEIGELVNDLSELTSISKEYIKILFKITGITFISEIASDISKDCGYVAMAQELQIIGKLYVLFISLPVFSELLSTIGSVLS